MWQKDNGSGTVSYKPRCYLAAGFCFTVSGKSIIFAALLAGYPPAGGWLEHRIHPPTVNVGTVVKTENSV